MTTTTLYTSRPVGVPPVAAARAFDALRMANTSTNDPVTWTVVAPSATLVLKGAGLTTLEGPIAPLRQVPGRLQAPSGLRSFGVEVDLFAWSHLRSEIGVRPRGRAVPIVEGYGQRRYLGLAAPMAEHLAAAVEAVIGGWQQEVLTEAAVLLRTAVGT
jgi:hypothetical protein